MPQQMEKRSRNRAQTAAAILDAAVETLAQDGFAGFGVNAVARRAGCDKQLVYRYFGGLEGLAEALGDRFAAQLMQGLAGAAPARSYGELMEQLAVRLLRLFREHPLLAQVAAWEAAEPSPLARALAAKRGAAMAQWLGRQRGALLPPEGVDAPASNALLIGAIQHLAMMGRSQGAATGLALVTDQDWARAEQALRALVRAAYGAAA